MTNAIGVDLEDEGKDIKDRDIKDGLENVLGLGEKKPAEPAAPTNTPTTEEPDCGPWGCQDEPVKKA